MKIMNWLITIAEYIEHIFKVSTSARFRHGHQTGLVVEKLDLDLDVTSTEYWFCFSDESRH